ncbi:MAG: fibronectin type III domain-containing protein [Treponema sp.]|nr:fibronectin type III domain-containing protein [Treponema sp.]
MKKETLFILSLYFFLSFSGSLYANADKTILLGGASKWDSILVRSGICEAPCIRPYTALVLSTGADAANNAGASSALDMALSFDEGKPGLWKDSAGNYRVTVSPALEAADRQWARSGNGAALFSGVSAEVNSEPLIINSSNRSALFAPGGRIGDFSLEFWLYPFHLENGEQIITWTSSLPTDGSGQYPLQSIKCFAAKNRLQWVFTNFFASPAAMAGNGSVVQKPKYLNIDLSGSTPVVPQTWSHHLIRFDSRTGMIEYLVNGEVQSIAYATVSGHESASRSGEVFTPITGKDGIFNVGSRFTGMMDELNIYSAYIDPPPLQKFSRSGRMETRVIDLGAENSGITVIDVRGGRTALQANRDSIEFRENGRFRFSDDSEMQFFIRTSDNPYRWDNSPWRTFTPGVPLPDTVRGRYIQAAVDFYPSSNGECSPYLEEMRITYTPNEAPMPPSSLVAVASDGRVQLRWKSSPDIATDGYLVYYGTKKGEYFGEDAILGVSPVNAGRQNNLVVNGLKNGVLYYFTVAAYKGADPSGAAGLPGQLMIGDFSREVTARPLQGLQF